MLNATRNGESLFRDDCVVASAPVAVRSRAEIPRLYSEIPVICEAILITMSRILKSVTDPLSSLRRELAPASVSAKCIVHGAAHSRDFISRKAHLSAIKFGVAIERAESI